MKGRRPQRNGKTVPVLDASEVPRLIDDGATISVSASSGLACPDRLLAAIGEAFDEVGSPFDLTVINPIAAGDMFGIKGVDHLAKDGLLRQVIAGSYPSGPSSMTPPKIRTMIDDNRLSAWNLPSGVLFQMHSAGATGQPGVLTKVGLDTFIDPRREGGALNTVTDRHFVQVATFAGEEWLHYPALCPDAALIRGTTADTHGNITTEHEGAPLGVLEQALATHNNGGVVIAQVKRLAKAGSLSAQAVRVPGAIVDAVVVVPDQMQATETVYDPALSGEILAPDSDIEPLPWGVEKLLARRAGRELKRGWIVNLGFGICAGIPRVVHEEGRGEDITWVTEQGAVGGFPIIGSAFGCALNPDAVVASPSQFTLLQGGGFDAACLSFMQIDQFGNVNVSLLPGRSHISAGIGGFADITEGAQKLIFVGTFMAGRGGVAVGDGRLAIESTSAKPKLVQDVAQVSFSGQRALERGADVVYVTERCVINLRPEGLVVTEVAPGVDLERDVLGCADLKLVVAENVRPMDPSLFQEFSDA